jgi:hypothetical protein
MTPLATLSILLDIALGSIRMQDMTSNYFVSQTDKGPKYFFFNGDMPGSVTKAWNKAKKANRNPAVFRPTGVAGPWDNAPVVGHRPRMQIINDISFATEKDDLEALGHELSQLHEEFARVGRVVPPQAVAAA